MNKVKDFLEKNAQWLALAVGVLWLGYMVYDHVLASKMATVEVKGAELGAGQVDQYIEENVIKKLNDDLGNAGVLPPLKSDYPAAVKATLGLDGEKPVTLANNWTHTSVMAGGGISIDPPPPPPNQQITSLPAIPALTNVDVIAGKSIVTNPAGAAGAQQERKLWATVFGTVPMADLQKAWVASGVAGLAGQPQAQQTLFLKVEVVRTEILPGGKLGNPVVFAGAPINLNAAPPAQPIPPFPGNVPQQQLQYKQAVAVAQKEICQPEFFVVTKGDGWRKPGEPLVQVGTVAQPPVAPPPPPPETHRPNTPRPPRPTPPVRTGGGGPRGMAPMQNPGTMIVALQAVAPAGGMGGAVAPPPPPPANALGAPPSGPFNPGNAVDVNIWVHDLNVENGKTYQYQMKYTISNPVFLFKIVCPPNNLAWADQFAIESPLSAPTPAVTIPDTTVFFVAAFMDGKTTVKFDFFVWGINGVTKTTVTASPGDLLDQNLRLTLVDARRISADDSLIILMDEAGNLITRNTKADAHNPDYAKNLKEANP